MYTQTRKTPKIRLRTWAVKAFLPFLMFGCGTELVDADNPIGGFLRPERFDSAQEFFNALPRADSEDPQAEDIRLYQGDILINLEGAQRIYQNAPRMGTSSSGLGVSTRGLAAESLNDRWNLSPVNMPSESYQQATVRWCIRTAGWTYQGTNYFDQWLSTTQESLEAFSSASMDQSGQSTHRSLVFQRQDYSDATNCNTNRDDVELVIRPGVPASCAGAAGCANFPGSNQVANLYIAANDVLTYNAGDRRWLMLHELGHAMGLPHEMDHPAYVRQADHNPDWCPTAGNPNNIALTPFDNQSVMGYDLCGFPGYSNPALSEGDQAGIRAFYPLEYMTTEPEPTCTDGLQNGDETGVDCGGSCDACVAEPTCNDGVQNGDETGVDCGGSCGACQPVGGATQRLTLWNPSHGKYLVAEENGGHTVNANRDFDGPWEHFTMTSLSSGDCIRHNDTVTIQTSDNYLFSAQPNGALDSNRTAVGPWEEFVLVNHSDTAGCLESNDQISLRSHFSRYVVAEHTGQANANREAIGPWERFRVQFEGQRPLNFVDGQIYHIQFRRSGKWLDLSAHGTENSNNVQQWAFHGGTNQRVQAISHNDGWFTLRFLHSNRCVDGNQGRNNENLYQWDCHMGNNQRFRAEHIGGTDMVLLRMNHGGHCMDQEGHGHDGGNVKLWGCASNNLNQQVRLFLANPN